MPDTNTSTSDNGWFENFFTPATSDSDKASLWDTILNSGGQIIGAIPTYADDLITGVISKEVTQQNENITSKEPAVSAEANAMTASSMLKNDNVKYALYGVGAFTAIAVLIKLIK